MFQFVSLHFRVAKYSAGVVPIKSRLLLVISNWMCVFTFITVLFSLHFLSVRVLFVVVVVMTIITKTTTTMHSNVWAGARNPRIDLKSGRKKEKEKKAKQILNQYSYYQPEKWAPLNQWYVILEASLLPNAAGCAPKYTLVITPNKTGMRTGKIYG